MNNKTFVFFCFVFLSLSAFASEDEMKTETKAGPGTSLPATSDTSKAPVPKAPKSSDLALRTKIRKIAPFWIDSSAHGASVRLNKDGSFTSEAGGGGSTAGQWKVLNGELHLQYSDGGENLRYPLSLKGPEVLIHGKKAQKNRFNLN